MNIFSSCVYWSTCVGIFFDTWQVGHEIPVRCWRIFGDSFTTLWWSNTIRLPQRWFRSFSLLFEVFLAFVLNCKTKFNEDFLTYIVWSCHTSCSLYCGSCKKWQEQCLILCWLNFLSPSHFQWSYGILASFLRTICRDNSKAHLWPILLLHGKDLHSHTRHITHRLSKVILEISRPIVGFATSILSLQ